MTIITNCIIIICLKCWIDEIVVQRLNTRYYCKNVFFQYKYIENEYFTSFEAGRAVKWFENLWSMVPLNLDGVEMGFIEEPQAHT